MGHKYSRVYCTNSKSVSKGKEKISIYFLFPFSHIIFRTSYASLRFQRFILVRLGVTDILTATT